MRGHTSHSPPGGAANHGYRLGVPGKISALIATWLLAIAMTAQAAWASVTTNVLVTPTPQTSGVSAQVARVARQTLEQIARDMPTLPPPVNVEIRLVFDTSQLAAVAPPGRNVPTWAVGVAFPGTNVVAVALTRKGQELNYLSTVSHELAHAALDSALGDRAPHWLHEGFAALYSSDEDANHMTTLTGIAWFGNATPLDQLDATFRANHVTAGRAYAQSYDFVKYLSQRGRYADRQDDGDPWPFRRFVAAMAAGVAPDQAAIAQFGEPLSALFEQWQASLSERYFLLPVALLSALFWLAVCALLVVAWWRKRRAGQRVLAAWGIQETADDQAALGEAESALGRVEEGGSQIVEQPLQ